MIEYQSRFEWDRNTGSPKEQGIPHKWSFVPSQESEPVMKELKQMQAIIVTGGKQYKVSEGDVIFVENVGNLVCPADFPLGTDYRVVVISTTEGDDMVRKHHDIFIHSDIAILNKVDIADAVDVDPNIIASDYKKLTGGLKDIYMCSVKKDQGLDEILKALRL